MYTIEAKYGGVCPGEKQALNLTSTNILILGDKYY